MAKQTLDAWIRECFEDKDKGEGAKVTAFSLMHLTYGPSGTAQFEVHSTRLPVNGGSSVDIGSLAVMFRSKAENYAQEIPGVQTFALLCFWTSSTEPQARHPFVVSGKSDYDGLTEEPTERGQKAQRMRHDEAWNRAIFARQGALDEYTLRLLAQSDRRINELAEENRDMWTAMRELIMKDMQLSHDKTMAEVKAQRELQREGAMVRLVPPLVNTVMGREVFPQPTADKALIDALADSLPPDMFQGLMTMGGLNPELSAALTSRFEKRAREREEEAAKAKALAVVKNPIADAGGRTDAS